VTVLFYALGVLLMVLGIGASIALHEIGHLVPAKAFGVRCSQYMVGFGKTLWSRRVGETEYGLKAIPLGGYVRMLGMFPPKAERHMDAAARSGRLTAMIDEARNESLAEIGPGEQHRAFYRLPTWQKITVMLGGPVMNLVIATVIFAFFIPLYGATTFVDGARVSTVSECVRPVSSDPAAQAAPCTAADRPSPAATAGLQPGDEFVSIAGQPVTSPADVGALVRTRADQPVPVEVLRDGRRVEVTLTPIANEVPQVDGRGRPVLDASGRAVMTTAGFIGTSTERPTQRYDSLADVPAFVWSLTERTGRVVITLPQRLVDVWNAAFGPAERDVEGPMSVVGVGRVAGEVASLDQVEDGRGGQVQVTWVDKAAQLWVMIAGLNIALFVFNLIPLLPLDGGHVAGALWEGLKRGFARVFDRPDPGYVDVARALPLTYAVSLVLIGMSLLLIYADLVKPIRL